jgi:outer membrane murein-binding lipoprotein Lpp
MHETNEVEELKARIARLEQVILEMTETIKILTESEERAKAFVARIDEIANTIKERPQSL